MYRVLFWSDERNDWDQSRLYSTRKMAQAELRRVRELTPEGEPFDAEISFDFVVFAHCLHWTIGGGDEWNCLNHSGMGLSIAQMSMGLDETWEWNSSVRFMKSCGYGQEPNRMRAIMSALRCLEREGLELLQLPHEIVRRG